MAYVALYRAYRPQAFKEVCGQEHIVKTLQNAIIKNKVAHAYLFSGPRGTGKTSIAKIIAKAVNCPNSIDGEPCNECETCEGITKGMISDVVEIDAASNNGVDEIREIRDKVKYMPSTGKFKVYIIDEVHMLSTGAFNALLKTLEEPPAHAIFILATTEIHKIPATILSRCQRFDFRAVGLNEIVGRINMIVENEKIAIDDEAISLIAECAEGGMRDALSLLDEAISFAGDKVTLNDVYQVSGGVNYQNMIELANNIYEKDSAKVLKSLEDIIDLGKEIPKICNDMIGFYRDMLLYKNNPQDKKAITSKNEFQVLAKRTTNQKIYFYLNVLNEAQNNMKFTNQKRTFLELALVKMSDSVEQVSIDNSAEINKLTKRIADLEAKIAKGPTISNLTPEMMVPKKEVIVPKQKDDFNYVTIEMIEDVLNNGKPNKKKALQSYWPEITNHKNHKILATTLGSGNVVACSDSKAIIACGTNPSCDYLMRKENKEKALELINQKEKIVDDYYVIPQMIWDKIFQDYLTKFKAGNKKPKLDQINIGIRLYNEDIKEVSEMQKIASDMFGDLVKFE